MIKPIPLFHTPESWDELMEWIERHSPEDRPHLIVAAGMAWNLATTARLQSEYGPNFKIKPRTSRQKKAQKENTQ